MSDDLLITPGSRKLEIKDNSGNVDAKIETDASGNLLITNAGGDISIGDTSSDVFIGDGTNNVDIVFEQDGEIRGTSGVTVTLGASGSNVRMASDLNLNGNDITGVGDLTLTGNLTITGDINSYNVTDLDVSDKTITLGVGQTEANSGGSGIVISGSNASILWDETNGEWDFNNPLSVVNSIAGDTVLNLTGTYAGSGNVALLGFARSGGAVSGDIRYLDATTEMEIGTSTAHSFSLKTSNTKRLTVNSSGNISFTGTLTGNGSGLTSLNASNISSGTLPVARLSDNIFDSYRRYTIDTASEDFNDATTTGTYHVSNWSDSNDTVANGPTGSYAWGMLRVTNWLNSNGTGDGYVLQEYFPHNTDTCWTRIQWNSSWGGWRESWGSGSDGSGSQLDADTVDGIHGASFLRSDTADTATGVITFAATPTLGGTSANEGGEIQFGAPTGGGSAFALDNYQGHFRVHTLQSGKEFRVIGTNGTTEIPTGLGTIWAAGNDGASSGLDADLLDGQHGSYYRNAGNINAGTISNSRLPNPLSLSGGNAILKLQETDVTNSPTWWHVADGGSYSIRLNNTGGYPIKINTDSDNDAVTSVELNYTVDLGGNKLQFGNETTSYIQNQNKQSTDVWRFQTEDGYIDIGSENTSWAHMTTDRNSFYMAPKLTVQGDINPYTDSSHNLGGNTLRWSSIYGDTGYLSNIYVAGNILHEGDTDTYIQFTDGEIDLFANGQNTLLTSSGGVVVNPLSASTCDFNARGDNVSSLLYVDASADSIGIGTSAPEATLEIYKTVDGDAQNLLIMNQKTYGSGTGTNERASINLGIAEAAQNSLNRLFGTMHVRTTNESDSSHGILSFGVRGSGAIRDDVLVVRGYSSTDKRVGINTSGPDHALDVNGNIGLNEYIYHNGDHNTYIRFTGDAIDLRTGGNDRLELSNTGAVVNTQLISTAAGNTAKGSIAMGPQVSSQANWSYLTGAHYNQATGSGNGSGAAGIAIIGSYGSSSENRVVIGGSIYESNPATTIEFWTHNAITHTTGGTKAMSINTDQRVDMRGGANVRSKFAVMSTDVHGSYDLYNNGTTYLNGNTFVDANLTVTSGDISTTGNLTVGSDNAGDNFIRIGKVATGTAGLILTNGGNDKIKFLEDSDEHLRIYTNNTNLGLSILEAGAVQIARPNLQFTQTGTTFENPGFTYHTNNHLYLRGGSAGLILSDDSGINTVQIFDGSSGYINFETGDGSTRARITNNGLFLNDNKNLYLYLSSNTSGGSIHMPRAGMITFYGDNSTHHAIGSRNQANGEADDLLITSYGAVYIDLDSNNNNTDGADFIINRHNATGSLFTVSGENGRATTSGDIFVGGSNNQQLRVRHIEGKDASSDSYGGLFLNYNSTANVQIGHSGNNNDLYIYGALRVGGSTARTIVNTSSRFVNEDSGGIGEMRSQVSGSSTGSYYGNYPASGSGSAFIHFVQQNFTGIPGAIKFYISGSTQTNSATSTYLKHQFEHDGDAHHDGDVIAYSTTTGSDRKLKKNIRDLEGSLDKTLKLRGVKFDWKDENKANDQLGFIAQEVEDVLPEIVKEAKTLTKEGETHLTVNYPAVVPLLVEAIKEQQTIINRLEERLNNLENKGEE